MEGDLEQMQKEWEQARLDRVKELRHNVFCREDEESIPHMTLHEIGIEFDLPDWLLLKMIWVLVSSHEVGSERKHRETRKV